MISFRAAYLGCLPALNLQESPLKTSRIDSRMFIAAHLWPKNICSSLRHIYIRSDSGFKSVPRIKVGMTRSQSFFSVRETTGKHLETCFAILILANFKHSVLENTVLKISLFLEVHNFSWNCHRSALLDCCCVLFLLSYIPWYFVQYCCFMVLLCFLNICSIAVSFFLLHTLIWCVVLSFFVVSRCFCAIAYIDQ